MAKSRTRKKFVKQPSPALKREFSNLATDYIKHWTTQEINRIQSTESKVLCIPAKNGYLVGSYKLTVHPNKTCDVYDHNRDFVHCFDSKISAILFTIYTLRKRYWTADELLLWDKEINKHYTDILALRNSIAKARQRQDYESVDIRQARLDIAESRLNLARDNILKLHKTAKYYKVWE
jgi:hypothetical protein